MDTTDLCSIPAGVSPDGIYNFDNPPTLGPAVIAVAVVLGTISTAFGFARLYINRNMLHSADYFTLCAVLTNIAFIGVICAQHKFYRHSWDIPVCWYSGEALKLPFIQTVLFTPAFFFPKAAIFLLYLQLFAIERRTAILIWFGLVITLLNYLSNIPLAAIYAAPRAASRGTIYYGVAASVVSLAFKIEIVSSADSAWLAAITSLLSLIETNIAIFVGCMPAFSHFAANSTSGAAFFRSLRTRLLGSWGQSSGSKSKSEGSSGQPPASTPKLATFGSNQTPRHKKKNYLELTDTLLRTENQTTLGDAAAEEHEMHSKPASTHTDKVPAEQGV
ncbi:hypothetical protein EKO27_g8807 [Xylaria grammica]|uniref:Rhodopsin domain-containing protein n=1 Tax=Xylaria grammica TaxID=363999 RepID=A0A439CVU4_9PEZI|nr:hypothetical protein EKO27_g8807 [Xylaria grammica]